MQHSFPVKVYYEDTDCLGIVYYANYLKYFERAREELFEAELGPLAELNRRGEVYVVVDMKCSFRAPAKHGDRLVIETVLSVKSPFRATFRQDALRLPGRELLVRADIDVTCLDAEGSIRELPDALVALAGE
ncbi:MAG: YbgC/FadM family acyl-CoA thioesterase [Myxococcales bacterium]|nr:YbgC/FadM family acyl-CoA thioesterase [Myxococcales bacterium]